MNRDLSLFLGQLFRRPHEIVALAPSSHALARLMCEELSERLDLLPNLAPAPAALLARSLKGASPKTPSPVSS